MSKKYNITKIFLFGETGMLGKYIYSYFNDNKNIKITNIHFKIKDNNFDLLENKLIDNDIDEYTCVINCIGLIPQRKKGLYTDNEYFLINSIFPHVLWSICRRHNAKMIQPSTDCVFDGKRGGYLETDIHNEINSYGMSKSLGEPSGCTVIRTSIIGKELLNKKSFLEWILSNNNQKIDCFTNHKWNGITCLQYCKIIEKIITDNIFWCGVRHIYSPTSTNKYELALNISQVFNLNVSINPIETNEPIDKTLLSNHPDIFQIPELLVQINDLKSFCLL